MEGLTRYKIAYNLEISPYTAEVEYPEGKIKYVFSSEMYRTKFLEKLEDNRKTINGSLTNRFKINVEFNILADIKLYSTIEKRGFLLYRDGERIKWQRNITLGGESLITMR